MASSVPMTVSQKHILYSEISAVTSVMRKNSRWASSAHPLNLRDSALASSFGLRRSGTSSSLYIPKRSTKEADLMNGFQELKRAMKDIEDIKTLPLPTILAPFFAIIRSPLSTGPITSTALSALHSFFVCHVISPASVSLEIALVELSSAVSHCKFEASDSSGDEVVLLKIMTVINDCMCGSVGKLLGDIEVCEMLETVLTTCCQMRLSEILRRYAESTMHTLVRAVFSRLYELDPYEEEKKLRVSEDESQEVEIRMNVSPGLVEHEGIASSISSDSQSDHAEPEEPKIEPKISLVSADARRPEFGLPSIIELLRVLINILDPSDQLHTDSTRLTALGILNAAFEASGPCIGNYPSLAALILDSGCKFLFQLARSENMGVLHQALRTVSTIFVIMRSHLKLQQELFLVFTLDRLAPPNVIHKVNSNKQRGLVASPLPGTPVSATPVLSGSPDVEAKPGSTTPSRLLGQPAHGETRDIILETLSQISRYPSFMVDLYTNYDCDINCDNLFERLIDYLTESVYPAHAEVSDTQQQHAQYLCLDLLLAFVNDMALRAGGASQPWPSEFTPPQELMQSKSRKELVMTGAARFNAKPKNGLAYLEEKKLIYADLSPTTSRPRSLAIFLKECTRLDKRLLGDFISRPENLEVLKAFINLFDFKDKPIADAMREMLETFRLPGESQQIARITETFASIFFSAKPAEIKSEDAVYVLAYSVIMLNTDLHNPQVRKRMTLEDYERNLRGVNDNEDFSPEFLQSIYDSIRKREIVMPEEHTGQLGFEYAWKELLARSRQSGKFMSCNTDLFDMDMFKSVWKPVISAIAHAFISFDDDYVIQRAIAGFRQCATLAGCFALPDVFDFVVVSLSQATGLLSDSIPTQIPNYPVVDVEGQAITVSSLSVKFGTNFKGQLAAVVLFNIVNGNGNALREGWTQIFEMFQNLFLNSLLPTRMLQMEDFLGGVSMIPLRGSAPSRPAARNDGGLLSALSSYLMAPYGGSSENLVPDATDTNIEETLCTIDCITSCRLDELYTQVMQLDLDAFVAAVRALEALAHERTVARLKQESDDILTNFNTSTTVNIDGTQSLIYDPASVYLLETMVSIACQTPHYIEDSWPIVFEHLTALLSASAQYSVLLIERAVVGLLRLCLILAQKRSLRDQIYVSLDLLSGLPSSVFNSVAEQVLSGILLLVQNHREIIHSQTEWNLVFALIRAAVLHPEAARLSFDMVSSLILEERVNVDNFGGLIMLLDEFATAAGVASENQQNQGHRGQSLSTLNSPVIERGRKAVDLLFGLKKFVVSFSEAPQTRPDQAWRLMCLPLLSSLGRQSINACREIRRVSITHLQRILLGPNLLTDVNEHSQVEEIFNRVVFPLLDDLLRPEVCQRDTQGMPETRLRASALLCKVFMHYEVRERASKPDIRILWIQILDLLDRLMNIDKGDQLYEAVPESLKNVVLVMNAAGILVPPLSRDDQRDEQQRTLWSATQERIDRFLPGFLAEVITIPTPSSSEHNMDIAVSP